jgi:hypothetical protein
MKDIKEKKEMGAIDDIAKGFSKNQLIGYFLILWAVTFFFSAINGFFYLDEPVINMIIDVLWSLAELGITAVLILLGVKFLNQKQEPAS